MEHARVRLFRIEKCGYYRRGEKTPVCGDINSTFSALGEWTQNLHFGETCTYKPRDGDEHDKTYCLNLQHNNATSSYLLTLWNGAVATKGNTMASVPIDATVGSAQVLFTKFPKDSIPGFATYFWILPDKGLFATISFANRTSSCRPFYRYMRGFLGRFFSAHIIYKPNDIPDIDLAIEGYKIDDESGIQPIKPSFLFSPAQNPKHVDIIRHRRAQIRKIAHREELIPKHTKQKTLIKSMLLGLGIPQPDVPVHTYKVKYELTYSPTKEELEDMIKSYEASQTAVASDDDEWEDIGFMFANEDRTYWLSASIERHEADLQVTRDNDEVVNAASLLAALEQKRDWLLRNIQGKK